MQMFWAQFLLLNTVYRTSRTRIFDTYYTKLRFFVCIKNWSFRTQEITIQSQFLIKVREFYDLFTMNNKWYQHYDKFHTMHICYTTDLFLFSIIPNLFQSLYSRANNSPHLLDITGYCVIFIFNFWELTWAWRWFVPPLCIWSLCTNLSELLPTI